MNQNKTSNFTVLKTYKIRGGYLNSTMTFEVQDGKDIVRIRHYCTLSDPNRYEPCFHVSSPEWGQTKKIDADVWYDIKVARDVYRYMTRNEKNNPEFGTDYIPFVPVP